MTILCTVSFLFLNLMTTVTCFMLAPPVSLSLSIPNRIQYKCPFRCLESLILQALIENDDDDLGNNSKKSNDRASSHAKKDDVKKWSARFVLPDQVPSFIWNPPVDTDLYLSMQSFLFCRLLFDNFLIDKSKLLYRLLKGNYDYNMKDFSTSSLLVVYPRRFAKTTLLGFIEALLSPAPTLDSYKSEVLKTKIAALEYGKELLEFGQHPVLRLNLVTISSIEQLNFHIEDRLKRAGLDDFTFETLSPVIRVTMGVKMLNAKFKADTGVETRTVILVDEYDKPFRTREISTNDPFLGALLSLFSIGKDDNSGVSLLILCGLTRMVGTGVSTLNNLVDVSQQTKYHGLCGISSMELVHSTGTQLDEPTRNKYGKDTNFETILSQKFRQQWDGFRFGIDHEKGDLDPVSPEGILFSPIDIWEIVRSLFVDAGEPSPKWIEAMESEFAFTIFAEKYTATPEGRFDLFRNLRGGWVDMNSPALKMTREDYLTLKTDPHVKKVLYELGLLSVQDIKDGMVLLGPPNFLVTKNALGLLVKITQHGETPKELAHEYLSKDGFKTILSLAANNLNAYYGVKGRKVLREFGFQDAVHDELFFRFPLSTQYDLLKEAKVTVKQAELGNPSESESVNYLISGSAQNEVFSTKTGFVDLALLLHYDQSPTSLFLIELKFEKIEKLDNTSIDNSHNKNIREGTKQVEKYVWRHAVNMEQRVVVSGVWHPKAGEDGTFELSHRFEFLEPKISSAV